jgi:hypothetical protein
LTLTPGTALERGYVLVKDVTNPYYAFNELLELAVQKGFHFGSSSNDEDCNSKFGLYRQVRVPRKS